MLNAMDRPRGLPLGELTASAEFVRLASSWFSLGREPRGSGEPVMTLPGFMTTDASMAPLRTYLGRLNYRVSGWKLGLNTGNVRGLLERSIERVADQSAAFDGPVHLVGWSLGGVIAREVAREIPEAVSQVITLGSPVVGGPKYTRVGRYYEAIGYDLDELEEEIAARDEVPISRPITAIYTRRDGIVSWKACIDERNPNVRHIEVKSTHFSLGLDPAVYRILARVLAGSRVKGDHNES